MRSLSFVITLSLFASIAFAQSPHGKQLKIDCSSCHVPTSWKIDRSKMTFDHNTQTSFKLDGQHSALACAACHKSPVFSQAGPSCSSCHRDVHQGSLGPDCATCHDTKSWLIVDNQQIHQRTRFPLAGAHQNVDCQSCHSGYSRLYFPPMSVQCITCHSQQYYATTAPNHVQAGFSTNCQSCHNVIDVSWGTTHFNHDFFPLVGGHAIQNCFACHKQGTSDFKGLSTNCYSCHKPDYMNASFPNHVSNGFSTNCTTCHTINGWSPATFDHSTTGFALTGAHASLQCTSCHKNQTARLSPACYSCHANDFNNTTDPNHVKLGFPQNCAQCHNTTSWANASFDHSTTGFPLTGAHSTVQCAQCHTNGYTTPPPTDCYSCHTKDYNNATDPNHVQQGFPHNCAECHNTSSWSDASFDHSTTGFPLTGAHTSIQCAQCHTNGYNTPLPTDCYSCHTKDYNNTTDPNHVQLGYPHDCTQCHSTSTWADANFNHTQFPITSGNHAVPPLTCSQCHTNPASFAVFSCTTSGCHSQAETDPHHTEVRGYVYSPTSCYSCHANGGGD